MAIPGFKEKKKLYKEKGYWEIRKTLYEDPALVNRCQTVSRSPLSAPPFFI